MFGSKKKINILQSQIQELQDQLGQRNERIAELEGDHRLFEETLTQRQQAEGALRELFANFQTFGQSLMDVQSSLAGLANDLKFEKERAVEAQGVSIDSRSAIEVIAANLATLADSSEQTATQVGELDSRA